MSDCLFCKIVAGQIPSSRVYEDDRVLAFLDLYPLATGHTLVIPKAHSEFLTDTGDDDMAAVGRVLPRIARAVMRATGAPGFNLFQANGEAGGQEIPHVHVHIVPRTLEDGLGFRWKAGSYAEGEMEAWRQKIAAHVV